MGTVSLIIIKSFAWMYAIQPKLLRDFEGHLLGWILLIAGVRADVIRKNLEYAYPDDFEKREQLFKAAYNHLGRLILDLFVLLGPFKWFAKKNTRVVGLENWITAKAKGKGVIFLVNHIGNWELMAGGGCLAGIDVVIVTKHLKPEWLHKAIEKGRLKCGVVGTYEPKTYRAIIKQLRRKETVGIILDQYAGPPIGLRVPFFGKPVGTSTALAMLVKRTGAVVLPACSYRDQTGKWIIDMRPELEWVAEENSRLEIAKNTAKYAAQVEKDIRCHPEQWLWTHRRFKGDLSPFKEGEWEGGRQALRERPV